MVYLSCMCGLLGHYDQVIAIKLSRVTEEDRVRPLLWNYMRSCVWHSEQHEHISSHLFAEGFGGHAFLSACLGLEINPAALKKQFPSDQEADWYSNKPNKTTVVHMINSVPLAAVGTTICWTSMSCSRTSGMSTKLMSTACTKPLRSPRPESLTNASVKAHRSVESSL